MSMLGCRGLVLLFSSSAAAHMRAPASPPPAQPGAFEAASGEHAAAVPAKLCDLKYPYWLLPSSCTLTPAMLADLSEDFREARQNELRWRAAFYATIGVLALSFSCWFVSILFYCSRRPTPHSQNVNDVKVVYLRPDAWPMQVLNPGAGDFALTVPVEPIEIHGSDYDSRSPITWVQMESPVTTRSNSPSATSSRASSSSSRATTTSAV